MSTDGQKRLIALLLGLATICAGFFTWRAAQIGSSAAFQDRQSIGETVKVEQQDINVAVEAVRQASAYNRYLADYATADELDAQAGELAASGDEAGADEAATAAQSVRAETSLRASEAGVFGLAVLASDLEEPAAEPRLFDLDQRLSTLAAEQTTGLLSPGNLDPQGWADKADDIRDRIRHLSLWVVMLLGAVALYTAAELTADGRRRIVTAALGSALFVVAAVGGLTLDFF